MVREIGRGRCGRTQPGNDRRVAGRWKKVMETGIRFANIMENALEAKAVH